MPELLDDMEQASTPLSERVALPAEISDLRLWYRRAMIRIQSDSVCLRRPIFETLGRTSTLADKVISRAYEIAVRETAASHPPESREYIPSGQLWTIALGRLGMQEFDLASDADLVFVLDDASAGELPFWTRVAERVVTLITAIAVFEPCLREGLNAARPVPIKDALRRASAYCGEGVKEFAGG